MPATLGISPLSPSVGGEGDVSTRIVNGTPTSDFPSVGTVGDSSGGFCTGTLIAPRYVLTAAHCAEDMANGQGRFRLGGVSHATSRIYVHPNYQPDHLGADRANDLAIFELRTPITTVTPSPIFRDVPFVGQILTLVGFGAGGNGNSGHNGDFGIKRVGTTPIDGVTERTITWEFDNNSESNTAPGDSGGPAFIQENGVYYVAGVTSGGERSDAAIGDHSFDTRVDAYATWIDTIVNSNGTGVDDYKNGRANAATLNLNGAGQASKDGVIEISRDVDFFKFTPSLSRTTTITLRQNNSIVDPILTLFNASGQQLATNDDANGLNSRITYRLIAGRQYYLRAAAYRHTTGAYTLALSPTNRSGSGSGGDSGFARMADGVLIELLKASNRSKESSLLGMGAPSQKV